MSCVEHDQGDLDRPRRRAQFSIEKTPSSTDGVLVTPLDDYVGNGAKGLLLPLKLLGFKSTIAI